MQSKNKTALKTQWTALQALCSDERNIVKIVACDSLRSMASAAETRWMMAHILPKIVSMMGDSMLLVRQVAFHHTVAGRLRCCDGCDIKVS